MMKVTFTPASFRPVEPNLEGFTSCSGSFGLEIKNLTLVCLKEVGSDRLKVNVGADHHQTLEAV